MIEVLQPWADPQNEPRKSERGDKDSPGEATPRRKSADAPARQPPGSGPAPTEFPEYFLG